MHCTQAPLLASCISLNTGANNERVRAVTIAAKLLPVLRTWLCCKLPLRICLLRLPHV